MWWSLEEWAQQETLTSMKWSRRNQSAAPRRGDAIIFMEDGTPRHVGLVVSITPVLRTHGD